MAETMVSSQFKLSKQAGIFALLASLGFNALAQDKERVTPLPGLEEVVVVAEKREQNLQRVAKSISVIDGEQMEKRGHSTLLDIAKEAPAFSHMQTQDPRTSEFRIRGIGSATNVPGLEPSSAIIIDGETLSRNAALNNDLIDVQRVEVLKGPQSLLFGKNASAGALHVISKRPRLDGFSGHAQLTLAEDQEYMARASLNMPVSTSTALRVNGFYKYAGGYVDNVDPGQPDGGREDSHGLRAQLYRDEGGFDWLIRAEYSKKEYGPFTQVLSSFPDQESPEGRRISPQVYEMLALSGQARIPNNNTRTSQTGDRNHGELENVAISGEANWQWGEAKVTYAGSWRDWKLFTNEDQDLIAFDKVPNYFAGRTYQETTQHELRLEGNRGALDYIASLLYYWNENDRSELWQDCQDPAYNGFGLPVGTVLDRQTRSIADCGGAGSPFNFDFSYESQLFTHNLATFAKADWQLRDNLVLLGGLRLLHERQKMAFTPPNNSAPPFTYRASDTAVVGKLGAQYYFGDDLMVYLTYTTGYKGRAWDNGLNRVQADFEQGKWPIRPETSRQWETGLRSTWLDNRLRFNATAFRTRYRDFQERAQFFDTRSLANADTRLFNVGNLMTQGLEAEIDAWVSDKLTVSAAVSFQDAAFVSDAYVGCIPQNRQAGRCVQINGAPFFNIKGQQLPNAPKLMYNIRAGYALDLPAGFEGQVNLQYRWLDEQAFSVNGSSNPIERRGAFGIADLSLDVNSADGKYQLTFYVKNLFDKLYYGRSYNSDITGYALGVASMLARDYRRYMGLSARVSF